MKAFFINHEDAIIFSCFGILVFSILIAFVFCGISENFTDQEKDLFTYVFSAAFIFGALFPFVVLEINERTKNQK